MIWEDASAPARERADALAAAVQGRKDLKRLGKWLEDAGDTALRQALIARARAAGAELPDEAVDWPGKRLLRRALGREQESRKRTNPISRDDAFVCMKCGMQVPPNGRTPRDHCPRCLSSRHVDIVPGDRANPCQGRMDPHGIDVRDQHIVILYQCTRCGAEHQNRAVVDGEHPDDWAALVKLSAGRLG
jgi:DNA-directed RNA polymerase subunit RPC12/RpoP